LLGEKVRFDGGHKQDKYLTKTLSDFFEYLPFCPEVAIGLGTPRPTLRLVKQKNGHVQAIMPTTSQNYTEDLNHYAQKVLPRINHISGYILKSKSPSCGMARVKVYDEAGNSLPSNAVGIYAQQLMTAMPHLPIEEEGRLNDPLLKENFIKRVFAYHDWQIHVAANLTYQSLVDFHTRHKLLLILHHYGHSKTLGQMLTDASNIDLKKVAEQYLGLFMQALAILPHKRHHGQVLTRIVTKINQSLEPKQKQDVLAMIQEYLAGELPLSAPVRLIKHYLTAIDNPFIQQQSYLNPYPESLGLMNAL
jgi:uncharacterized protein YbgA (DUF1722 family)/uncharacterized protein YbbK (DUF523 family)